MKQQTFSDIIVDGKFSNDVRFNIAAYMSTIKDGTKVNVNIKNNRATRSNNQNRYYWGVVVNMISDHTGHTPKEVHEYMKYKILSEATKFGDDSYMKIKSTADLDTLQMEVFLEAVRKWASVTVSVSIPEPHECEVAFQYTKEHNEGTPRGVNEAQPVGNGQEQSSLLAVESE